MSRRKKRKVKKIFKITIPSLIIIILLLINRNIIYKNYLYITSDYNNQAINTFLEEEIYKDIKNCEYSKTLEQIINTKYYDEKYLKEYLAIQYIEKDNYLENISKLLDIGYNSNDINKIYSILNDTSIELLINNNYIKDIVNIISISYFKEDNLERYIKYHTSSNLDNETIITYVNIGLDKEYYTSVNKIKKQDDVLVLVNKYNVLDKTYIPSDLEDISTKYGSGKLRKEAKNAFEEMCNAALKDNIKLYSGSAYRSYDYQKNLYDRYVLQDGKILADTYAARAGYSEHQTGLAIDILNGNWNYISASDKEYTWLINNSYKYGYILRYPKGKEDITGYMYEEWHFRYLGKDIAKKVYELDITYDEYVAKDF